MEAKAVLLVFLLAHSVIFTLCQSDEWDVDAAAKYDIQFDSRPLPALDSIPPEQIIPFRLPNGSTYTCVMPHQDAMAENELKYREQLAKSSNAVMDGVALSPSSHAKLNPYFSKTV